jgi:glycosyltransferase involved in cell wall biosynthesis
MARDRLRLLYVCDFSSVHARTLVEYFAGRPELYDVHVASTGVAEPMEHVRLLQLADAAPGRALRSGLAGRVAYRVSLALPAVYARLRGRELLRQGRVQGAKLAALAGNISPDLIHVLRTQPEGLVAVPLRQLYPDVPFLLSTWGQDFVVWARTGRAMGRATAQVVAQTDHAFPDNARDARLLMEEYGLSADACSVMPATGGLALDALEAAGPGAALELPGQPTLLSMRGYENAYIRIRVLLAALRIFVRRHPGAHLYIDGPAGHPGRAAVDRWAARYRVSDHVSAVHLGRSELFRYMQATDMYVSATTSDGLPMSLLEALFFGQIPVVSNLESIRPPIIPGQNGVVFDELTPIGIAAAWERALPLLPDRAARQQRNRDLLARHFDRPTNITRVEAAYQRLSRGLAAK